MSAPYIVVLGAGAWGTAISIALTRAGRKVKLLPKFDYELEHLQNFRENTDWLPEVHIPEEVSFGPCYDDLAALAPVLEQADAVFWVAPVQFSVDISRSLARILPPQCPVVICSKGLVLDEEAKTGKLLSTALSAELQNPLCVLSGPNFAREVARNWFTSAVIASTDSNLADTIACYIKSPRFRPYVSSDMISVQVAGALKNVIAIACGIAAGLELGQNATSALIAMAIAECSKISTRCGGVEETLLGVSGVGDISLTCLSVQSRNTGFGLKIGKGEDVDIVIRNSKHAVEGYYTAKPAYYMSRQLGVHTPVLDAVYHILYDHHDPMCTLEEVLKSPDYMETEIFR